MNVVPGGNFAPDSRAGKDNLKNIENANRVRHDMSPAGHVFGEMGSPEWAAMNVMPYFFPAAGVGFGGGGASPFADLFGGKMQGMQKWIDFASLLPLPQEDRR